MSLRCLFRRMYTLLKRSSFPLVVSHNIISDSFTCHIFFLIQYNITAAKVPSHNYIIWNVTGIKFDPSCSNNIILRWMCLYPHSISIIKCNWKFSQETGIQLHSFTCFIHNWHIKWYNSKYVRHIFTYLEFHLRILRYQ